MNKLYSYLLLAALPASAMAQSSAGAADQADAAQPSRWRLGIGVVAVDNAYVGRGLQLTPFPLIDFDGDRVFFHGITGGVHLLKSGGLVFDAIVTTGFNNIKASDFGRADLARRGIDRDDLQNRDRSIDIGVAGTWQGQAGQLRAEAKTDISGSSEGAEYSLKYAYPMHALGFRITPSVGATFLSAKVADYYYGIHAAEVRRGVPAYRPGGALIPEFGVNLARPLNAKWALLINAKYSALPNKISDSPLVDGSGASTVFVGISRAL